MTNPVLAERYAQCVATPSDINEHLPTFVRAVDEVDATIVVELGVRSGVSTIAWLFALADRGRLYSVDCAFPSLDPGTGVNLLDPQGPLGVQPHWLFLLGYDTWQTVLDALPQSDIDLLLLDTNHVFSETVAELELYYPRMRSGGRMFLHDTALIATGNAPPTPQPDYPVRTAMEQFCTKHDLRFEDVDHCSGLGTIYVP